MAGKIFTNENRLTIVVVHPIPIELMRGYVTTAAMNDRMLRTKFSIARQLEVCFELNSVNAVAMAP
jgi:hypothetical protein